MPSKKRSYPSTKTVVYDGILGPPLSVCHHSDLRHQNYLKLVPLSAASVESMVCHLSVTHPHLQEVCTCLVLENSMYVLTFALGLCRSICFFLSPPVCFPQFCMVLPSFLHSLPRLNGLERGVCQLSVPPFARCMHLSCVESSMYTLTFKWLTYVKKVVLRRYASFFRNHVPGCAILSVPWQPPKKCLATQKRLTPCWFLCETVGFEVLLLIFHIFRSGKEGKNPTIQKVV